MSRKRIYVQGLPEPVYTGVCKRGEVKLKVNELYDGEERVFTTDLAPGEEQMLVGSKSVCIKRSALKHEGVTFEE